jgi:hypothetical protein
MSKDDRDNKVRAVLQAATGPLGPTEIARLINEPWCVIQPGNYAQSSAITPVCRRIGASATKGKYIFTTETKQAFRS